MLALHYKLETFVVPFDAYYTGKNKEDLVLTKMVSSIETMVKNYIESPHPVHLFVNENLDELFALRLSSLAWLKKNHIVIDDVSTVFEEALAAMKHDVLLSVLYHNNLFAIRTNIRAINALLDSSKKPSAKTGLDFSDLPEIPHLSFTDFINTVSLTAPDIILSVYVDWLIASLYMEFGLIATFVIHKESIFIESAKINELAAFIADSAQSFGALSKEMKPSPFKKYTQSAPSLSASFLTEQTYLAEQDIHNL